MKKLLIFTICFCFLLGGCNQGSVETISSNTVMSSQVYQSYHIKAEKGRTDITATFRVGGATGTTLELTEPGKISYNDAPLPVSAPGNLIGTNYRMKGTDYRSFSKNYRPAHVFSFTDNDGKTYINSINLLPLEISAANNLTLEASQPTAIQLSRAVAADETLTIAINSIIEDQIPTDDNSVYFNKNRSAIIITPKYWQTKSIRAKAELEIKVKKNAIVSQGTPPGGSITAVYSAAPVYLSVGNAKPAPVNANTQTADDNSNKKPVTANANQQTDVAAPKPESKDDSPKLDSNSNSDK